jgi:predicted AAA+ superfamily ATPase
MLLFCTQRMIFKTHIHRAEMLARVREALAHSPVVTLLGPRQCGKTDMVRPLASSSENYFDLHAPADHARLEAHGFNILSRLEGIVVVDEAQRCPEIFPYLRVLADRPDKRTRFLLTGSASPDIATAAAESLAGRVRLLNLGGFTAEEIGWDTWRELWLKGGYPRAFLHQIPANSMVWRNDYLQQFIGRDLPALAEMKLSVPQVLRLLQLIAHCHGQNWNHSEAGRTIGASYHTVARYIDLFHGAFITRELRPYFVNIGKRLRKAPKLYLRDSGLLHALLGAGSFTLLEQQQRYGASWEGFCIEQIIGMTNARDEECFTWSVQGANEVDFILQRPSGLFGFEFKTSDAPKLTASMAQTAEDIGLKHLFVVYPGDKDYLLADHIEAVGFQNLNRCLEAVDQP